MKAQRFAYLKSVKVDGVYYLEDTAGQRFEVPIINEKGSKEYKRAVTAANSPERFCIKVRCKGTLSAGELTFGKYPAKHMEGAVPVENFIHPGGGLEQYSTTNGTVTLTPTTTSAPVAAPVEAETLAFIHTKAVSLKPQMLFIGDLKWKYLIRNIIRGKNIMMTGPAGSGKTMAAKAAAIAIEGYSTEIFNLGSTQDPRATLIGNTQFDNKKGTVFNPSPFVKAIQKENTVIVLDELSRAHPEAHNILMSVLDQEQRYLRLDEAPDSPIIKVARGVSFIASANIGNEYTATRQIDKALRDRFTVIEMETLTADEEFQLLSLMYPSVDSRMLQAVGEITAHTRDEAKNETPAINTQLSTRTAVEIGSLLYDGFSLIEAAEITIYPEFEDIGGPDTNERTYMKQFIQKYIPTDEPEQLFEIDIEPYPKEAWSSALTPSPVAPPNPSLQGTVGNPF